MSKNGLRLFIAINILCSLHNSILCGLHITHKIMIFMNHLQIT